jgi:soluble lytic murein transglycosylase-like protein
VRCLLALAMLCSVAHAQVPRAAMAYRSELIREAQFQFGIDAPVPIFGALVEHESGWRGDVVAWDGGMSLGQLMPSTAKFLTDVYPDLGPVDAMNPSWSLRAMLRLNKYNYDRLDAVDNCNRWGKTLFAYNAGRGYVTQKESKSPHPLVWWGLTENEATTQSPANAAESKDYPRVVIYKLQAKYISWGEIVCLH